MPLNIQDSDGRSGPQAPAPSPLTHVPQNGNGHAGRTIGIVFAVLVFLAAVFLLYSYGVFDQHKSGRQTVTASGEQQQAAPAESTPPATATSPGSTTDQSKPAPETTTFTAPPPSSTASTGKGNLTIYIGSYKQRVVAEGEIGRWHDAGFEAFLKQTPEWFQVQLGRFSNPSDTRELIDTLKDGFEGGYWVGPA
jgi:cell division protein FtsN